MMDFDSLQTGMMKGKTMAIAVCVSVCTLGAEAVLLPAAMDSSYERYLDKQSRAVAEDPEGLVIRTIRTKHPSTLLKPPPRLPAGGKDRVS